MKEVNNQNLRNFELGSQGSMNVPIWNILRSQQRHRQDSVNLKNDTFCRLPVTIDQCIVGTEKHRDADFLLNYDDGDYSQGCGQIEEDFRA